MKIINVIDRKDQYYIWETEIFRSKKSHIADVFVELLNDKRNKLFKHNRFIAASKTPQDSILIYTLPIIDEDKFKLYFLEALYNIKNTLLTDISCYSTNKYDISDSHKNHYSLDDLVKSIIDFFITQIKNNLVFVCSNKMEQHLIYKSINKTFLHDVNIKLFNKDDINLSTCSYILNNSKYKDHLNIGFAYSTEKSVPDIVFPYKIECYESDNTKKLIKNIVSREKQSLYGLMTSRIDSPKITREGTIVDYVGYYIANTIYNLNESSKETYNIICSRVILSYYIFNLIETSKDIEDENFEEKYLPRIKQAVFETFIQLPKFKEGLKSN